MSCGNITIGSSPDCDNLPSEGTVAHIILINYNDIRFIYQTSAGVITAIILQAGKKAYKFTGLRNDVKKSEQVLKTPGRNRLGHLASFIIYDVSQVQKNNVRNLVKGRFVAIVESRGENDGSIEVLGVNSGLSVVPGGIRDASNFNVFTISLATPDAEKEKKLPQQLGDTYEEGIDIINGLIFADGILITADSTRYTVDTDNLYTVDSIEQIA